MANETLDVIIIGAGISGINTAYRIQEGLPDSSYAILDARSEMGGTWSLFKYPGIRSDADLHTFGFSWEPWKEDRAYADGPSILRYLKKAAAKHGIDKHIRYRQKALRADWSSGLQNWKVEVLVNQTEKMSIYCRFIVLGTGYYDYTQGLNTKIPGIESFKGTVVHPQFWPENFNYSNQKVVIIGSGATAATLVPAMSEKVSQVTMLQRSPSYFITIPVSSSLAGFIRRWLPENLALRLIRIRYILLAYFLVYFCQTFPNGSKEILRKQTESQLPKNISHNPHFVPSYLPWQQRMCIIPGGDFFAALRTGKANIITDHIETVKEKSIRLKSGQELDADIIITATGLKMLFAGGIKFFVDGEEHHAGDKHVWHGALLQDLPNLAFIFGYTNAPWTLGADAASQLFVRLLKGLRQRGVASMVPRIEDSRSVKEVPWLDLNSSYIKAAVEHRVLPKGGDIGPWKPRGNFLQDYMHARWGDITTGLQFYPIRPAQKEEGPNDAISN